MKNKSSFKPLHWLLDVIPKGIAVFAIAAGAYYAYAAITFPGVAPYTVTGVVGQFVGLTSQTYNGTVQGYQNVNAFCRDGAGALNGSHVCSAMEIINSYNAGNAMVLAQTGDAWLNSGPPGHASTLANDCEGWTVTNHGTYGSIWRFSQAKGLLYFCDEATYRFACCR